ncbi:RAMP superfamily CRISPR-associated protein [Intestinibacter sp.]
MKGIRFIKEYKINLVNLTPLKIGNGKDELDLLIDKNSQKPIILGSSIAGAIKSYLIDLNLKEKVYKYLGNEEDKSAESKIYIADAYGNQFKVSNRTGIKRSYKFGTAEDKMKYDIDFIDSNTDFELNFKLFAKDDSELKVQDELIQKVIVGFKTGNLRLGANKMSGFGRFKVEKVQVRALDLENKKDLKSYILDDKRYVELNLADFKDVGNEGYIEFDFEGSIIDSMIVKQEIYASDVDDVDCINMVNSDGDSIIPGTTIKGLFREYNTKILETLGLDDKLFLIEDIYGNDSSNRDKDSHKIGKLLTSDVVIENEKYCTYNRIKVDRFTGGVVTGGKFDEKRVQGDFKFRVALKKLEENNSAAVGLILLTLRDLGLAKLPIGSSSSIGAGRIKGKNIAVRDSSKTVKINFDNNKLNCSDIDYVNNVIKSIKSISEKEDASNGSK